MTTKIQTKDISFLLSLIAAGSFTWLCWILVSNENRLELILFMVYIMTYYRYKQLSLESIVQERDDYKNAAIAQADHADELQQYIYELEDRLYKKRKGDINEM